MEVIGGFIIFASFAAFILGIVNVVRPQAWMKVQKRLVGLFIILGSMAGCVAGGSMMPPAPATTASLEVDAGKSKVAAAPPAPKPEGLTQAEFDGMWNRVKSEMERCDAPVRRAGNAVGTGNVYAAFGPVKAAGETCKEVWLGMDRIEIPRSAKGEVKKALTDARETCETAAYLKTEAMEQMVKVLDGDARPSVMADLRDKMQRGGDLSSGCFIGFLGAAAKADLTMPELADAMKAAEAQ